MYGILERMSAGASRRLSFCQIKLLQFYFDFGFLFIRASINLDFLYLILKCLQCQTLAHTNTHTVTHVHTHCRKLVFSCINFHWQRSMDCRPNSMRQRKMLAEATRMRYFAIFLSHNLSIQISFTATAHLNLKWKKYSLKLYNFSAIVFSHLPILSFFHSVRNFHLGALLIVYFSWYYFGRSIQCILLS